MGSCRARARGERSRVEVGEARALSEWGSGRGEDDCFLKTLNWWLSG